jgi:hypothetical protein
VHHYRIVLRGKGYDAEKNGKIIGQFAELQPAQRCIEASAQRAEAWRAKRMAQIMAKTRAALAEEIRRDVPFERLFAAMFSVLHRRHERTGGGEFLELNASDPKRMLDEFLQTCTVRQARLLREIALELEEAKLQVRLCACGVPMRDAEVGALTEAARALPAQGRDYDPAQVSEQQFPTCIGGHGTDP